MTCSRNHRVCQRRTAYNVAMLHQARTWGEKSRSCHCTPLAMADRSSTPGWCPSTAYAYTMLLSDCAPSLKLPSGAPYAPRSRSAACRTLNWLGACLKRVR